MQYSVIDSNQKYEVEANEERPEDIAKLAKAMEKFYELQMKYEGIKEEYELAKKAMEDAFGAGNETFGLKKVKGQYLGITYVPESIGTLKKSKVMNENKVKALMNEFGIEESRYIDEVEKVTGGRKAYIKVIAE